MAVFSLDGQNAKTQIPAAQRIKIKTETNSNGIVIPGLDTKQGLSLYEDEADVYQAVLRSYVPNAFRIIEKLTSDPISESTLNDYAINVHGLKGISAGIGAVKLKEMALDLEKMSKAGDLAGVLAGNEALIAEAKAVVSNVETWLKEKIGESDFSVAAARLSGYIEGSGQ